MRRRLALSGLTALMLVACNAILGLDGDTVIATPPDGSTATDGSVTDAPSSSVDATADASDSDTGVSDAGLSDVIEPTIDAGPATIVLAAGALGGEGNANGTGQEARFSSLSGIALDKDGNHYAVDATGSVIRKIAANSLVVTTFAKDLDRVSGITYDGDHKLYVTEQEKCRLLAIDTVSGQSTAVIDGGCGDPTASTPRLKHPRGLVYTGMPLDKVHVIYIADAPFIRAYDVETGQLSNACGADLMPPGSGACSDHVIDAFDLAYDATLNEVYYRQDLSVFRFKVAKLSIEQLPPSASVSVAFSGFGLATGTPGEEQLLVGDDRSIQLISITTSNVGPVSGSSTEPARWLDGPTADARFEKIGAFWRLGPFNYEIADRTSVRVLTGSVVGTLAGRGRASGYVDAVKENARFSQAFSLTQGPNGIVYFYDRPHCTVRSYDPSTGAVATVAGKADVNGQTNGDAGAALLDDESDGIVWDGTSILYSSSANITIRSINPTTGAIAPLQTTFGLGPALASNGNGRVFSTGSARQSVIEWNRNTPNERKTIAGVDGSPSAPADGTGIGAIFGQVTGLCFDANLDAIFAVDQGAFAVRKILLDKAADGVVTTLAGKLGEKGFADDVGDKARFGIIDQIACDGKGHAFVNEPEAGVIRRIDLATGAVKTVAGTRGVQGIQLGSPGGLNQPLGPLVLPNGHLLVGSLAESALVDITPAP